MSTRSWSPTAARSRAASSARSTRLGIASVAVYSDADRGAPHVRLADEAVAARPGAAPARATSTPDRVLDAARSDRRRRGPPRLRVPAENAEFAAAVEAAGLAFVGPTPEQIRAFGAKDTARALAAAAGVPLLPGSERSSTTRPTRSRARDGVGFPVMLKSVAGGGGIGMRRVPRRRPSCRRWSTRAMRQASRRSASARCSSSAASRGRATSRCRCSATARAASSCSATATARCSAATRRWSRRRPRPTSTTRVRAALFDAARAPARADAVPLGGHRRVRARRRLGRGRVPRGEHPAPGRAPASPRRSPASTWSSGWCGSRPATPSAMRDYVHAPRGHSIEVRVYAEDPGAGLPAERRRAHRSALARRRAGRHLGAHRHRGHAALRPAARQGRRARPTTAPARSRALRARARRRRGSPGIETNRRLAPVVRRVAGVRRRRGRHRVARARIRSPSPTVEVLDGGQLHDRAGPARAARLLARRRAAERADGRPLVRARQPRSLGNAAGARRARVHRDRARRCASTPTPVFCLTGARDATPTLDGDAGAVVGAGRGRRRRDAAPRRGRRPRAAHVPARARRPRRARVPRAARRRSPSAASAATAAARCARRRPAPRRRRADAERRRPSRRGRRRPGAHARVGARRARRSARRAGVLHRRRHRRRSTPPTGGALQLVAHRRAARRARARSGRAPTAARPACTRRTSTTPPYAVGAVDFTGDMPILLGPDGPSLGGFVCPVTVATDERWKLGQLAPGDTVRFVRRDRALPARPRRHVAGPTRRAAACSRCGRRRRRAAGHVPAQRRRRPPRRVRADGRSTSTCGCACTRSRHGSPTPGVAGVVDVTPGHPLAAGPGRRRRADRRHDARRAARGRGRAARARRRRGRRAAPSTCRCRGTTRRRARRSTATCARCATTRRGARGTSSSSAASTASTRSTTCAASCSTPSTSCSASATCTSARRSRRRSTRATAS